ncbi:MAG TPA: NPCBM/NEW2 domain-containing protein [Verrucomicrobiae bacterium]
MSIEHLNIIQNKGTPPHANPRDGSPSGLRRTASLASTLRVAYSLTFLFVAWPIIAADSVWISSLDLSPITQGWGQPQGDKSVTGKPMAIAGKQFEHGLGTHAVSRTRIDLKGGAERFSALVGVDDAAGDKRASIVFKVVADGKTKFKTGVMRLGDAPQQIDIDVRGVKMLLLIVDSAGDGTGWDHADWAEAKLLVSGERPVIVRMPKEEAVVLTPKPPREPRINGPRIFGVRPGHPFLYTIPATGDRPMTFAARKLPKGLQVDPQTGQITGAIAKPGVYVVTFRTSNRLGKAERKFKIVCGDTLALTPHMGWNSWYVWENHITDKIMREAADAMVSSGMIDHGYQYVNIDDCWAVKPGAADPSLGGAPRDAQGKVNANGRFPDMKALTDYIHSKGLKAGIYTSPGPTTCAGHIGAYQHEELDVQRFVEWGFDFLKYDWCSYGQIAKNPDRAALQKPYQHIGDILRRQNRDIVLNLCQYGMGDVWEWGKQVGGHSWRTAGDLGGSFEGIPAALFGDGFDLYAKRELHKYGGPGGWNDPDYLLLGYLSNWQGQTALTPLTPNEQYSHVSLWCLVAAPLIFSGDMTRLDEFTLGLLTNDEVLDVDQDPLGKPGRRATLDEDLEVWAKDMEDGTKAVGLFNRGECETVMTAKWADLQIKGPRIVRDLWRQKDLGKFDGEFKASVPRHGVVLVRLRSK